MHQHVVPSQPGIVPFLFRRDRAFVLLHGFFILFCLCSAYLTYIHIPWRDEAQAWLMAKNLSPWGLFLQARHDDHPILWHLSIKALQTLGIGFPGMMALNWIFIVAAIGLLFYGSGLPLVVRLLVAFCPACLLEISFNARNYAIAIMLIFLAATLYRRAASKPLAFCFVLALVANTNVYAAAVFVGISVQFMLEQACGFVASPFSLRPLYTRYLAANVILVLGALLLVAQLAPIALPGELPGIKGARMSFSAMPGPLILAVFVCTFLPLLFTKTPGFPRIIGSAIAGGLTLVPMLSHHVGTRHVFMLVAGVVYFLWIYYDDLLRADPKPEITPGLRRTTAIWSLTIAVMVIACQPGGLRQAMKMGSDSTHAAQVVMEQKLDRPDVLLFATEATKASTLLVHFKNITSLYCEPPYPPGPMPFPDYFYTRVLGEDDAIPPLEKVKSYIMDLAHAHPGDTLLLSTVANDPGFTPDDPAYHLHLVYHTPNGPAFRTNTELFQIYALEK